jgi:hypothetical protein
MHHGVYERKNLLRNYVYREWSAAKRAKRNKNFYNEWKITRAFPTTHVSTYFFRKPTTFTIANFPYLWRHSMTSKYVTSYFMYEVSHEGKYCTFNKILVRNVMSFREWSAAKRAKRNQNFYHEWKITRAFPIVKTTQTFHKGIKTLL